MKETIRGLQQKFDEAELHADAATLQRLLADDFLSIGPKGFTLDKKAWIGRHGSFKYLALDSRDVDVRVYQGAAIVRCVQSNRATFQGQEMTHTVRTSTVWVPLDGEWRVVGVQFSPLVEEQPAGGTPPPPR
jgi:hypothetical protein